MTDPVLVLGATGGLVSATLDRLAAAGRPLVLQGRREDALEALAARLGAQVPVACVAGDVRDPQLGEQLWAAAAPHGVPTGLISLIGDPGRMPVEDWSPERFGDLFAINSAGPLLVTRDWAARLQAAGLGGNAVLFSTMQACYPFEGSLPYAMAKAGLGMGVQLLAKEFGGSPAVRVNAIAPGVNQAGMAEASIAKGKYQPYLDQQTIPRYGQPTDIAEAVMFLLQPDLYMTGQTLLMDGGLTLRRDLG